MFLIIDNSEEGVVRVSGIQNGKLVSLSFRPRSPQATASRNPAIRLSIIAAIDKFLKKQKISLKKIKGVGVVGGAGSFTSSRLATTFANTLAYALKVPVIALEPGWTPARALASFKKTKPGKYVLPKYSGEARVTIKNI